jgi:DNA-binding NarL/FixJ family response regulator
MQQSCTDGNNVTDLVHCYRQRIGSLQRELYAIVRKYGKYQTADCQDIVSIATARLLAKHSELDIAEMDSDHWQSRLCYAIRFGVSRWIRDRARFGHIVRDMTEIEPVTKTPCSCDYFPDWVETVLPERLLPVARCFASGFDHKTTAQTLGVSLRTIGNYKRQLQVALALFGKD